MEPVFKPQPVAPQGQAFPTMPAAPAPVVAPVQKVPAAPVAANSDETAPVTSLSQIIAYSKANPNSQYAKQAYNLIKSGQFDAQAAKEGVDLSWAGRPKPTAPADSQGQDNGQEQAAPASSLGDLDMQQLQQAGQKIVDSVQNAGTKLQHDANGTAFGEAKGVGDVLEGLLGSGAGIVQGISAPVTAVLQKLVSMDPAALKAGAEDPSFAKGDPTVVAAAQFAAAHPELTQNIRDALTVGGALYGGAEGLIPGSSTTLGEFASSGKGLLEDAASRVKAAAPAIKEAAFSTESATPAETAPKNGIGKKVLTSVASQAMGVQPSTIEDILKRPDLYTPEKMGEASRQSNAEFVKNGINNKVQQLEKMKQGVTPRDLADQVKNGLQLKEQELENAAKTYGGITGDRTPGSTDGPTIKVAKNWLNKEIESATGRPVKVIKVKDPATGKPIIDRKTKLPVTRAVIDDTPNLASSVRDPKDISALQKFLDTRGPALQKGTLSGNEYLNLRDDLTKLSKFDKSGGEPSAPLEQVGKQVRAKLNDSYRSRFPGLEKADADYEEKVTDLDRLKTGLIDNNGELSENAMGRIRNSTGDKFAVGDKLEELVPGIKSRVQKLKDIEDEQQRYRAGITNGEGELLDNAANVVHNSAGTGKDLLSNRLEEVAPGIGGRVKFLKGVEDIKSAAGIKTGTYGRALMGGAALFGGPFGVAAWALSHPDLAVPLLRKLGASAEEAEKITTDLGVATKK